MNEIPKISLRGTDRDNFSVVIFAATLSFTPFPSLLSVVTDDRKRLKCLNIVLNNKSGSLSLEFNWYVACAREQALHVSGWDDISNDIITLGASFHVFFNVCLHSRSFLLLAVWRKSDSSVEGNPQGNWRRNWNTRDVVASSPSFSRPAARAPRSACSQANWHEKSFSFLKDSKKRDVVPLTSLKIVGTRLLSKITFTSEFTCCCLVTCWCMTISIIHCFHSLD